MVSRRSMPRTPRLFTILVALLSLFSCAPHPIHVSLEQHEQRLVAYMSSVTVAIATLNGGVIGSGVVLKHRRGERLQVLSASHVWEAIIARNFIGGCQAEKCLDALMLSGNEKPIPLEVKSRAGELDLVLFESTEPMLTSGPTAGIALSTPARGSFVWVLGSPAGQRGTVTRGIVSNIITWVEGAGARGIKPGLTWIDVDSLVYYGNSGGPVFGSDGKLIGVIIYRSPWGGGRALSSKHIRGFLD